MKRYERGDRYDAIIETALQLSEELGYTNIKRDQLCEAAGVSKGLVNHHFKDMAGLREMIMQTAVDQKLEAIIAQGLAAGDPIAQAAPQALKKRSAMYLTRLKK